MGVKKLMYILSIPILLVTVLFGDGESIFAGEDKDRLGLRISPAEVYINEAVYPTTEGHVMDLTIHNDNEFESTIILSPSGYLEVEEDELVIDAKSNKSVEVTIRVPEDAELNKEIQKVEVLSTSKESNYSLSLDAKVNFEVTEAPFLIDLQNFWDKYKYYIVSVSMVIIALISILAVRGRRNKE